MAITHRLMYGTLVVGSFDRLDGGGPGRAWSRLDLYTPDDGSKPVRERRHCAGPKDESAPHRTHPAGYDSRCGWCYLGASHTEALHAAEVL